MEAARTRPPDALGPWTIGAGGCDDVGALVALVNGAYRGESSQQGWTTEDHLVGGQRTDAAAVAALLASPTHRILVARDVNGLCGCVLLEQQPGRTCYLGMLTVRPTMQARGVGGQLLEAGEAWARENFLSLYMEMTVIDLRHDLIPWYERRGYRATGEIRPFPYDDERFGLPKRADLRFVVLRRRIAP